MTQRELAVLTGIDPGFLSQIESGKRSPSTQTIQSLADTLKVPVHLLMLLGAEAGELRQLDAQAAQRIGEGLLRVLVCVEQESQ